MRWWSDYCCCAFLRADLAVALARRTSPPASAKRVPYASKQPPPVCAWCFPVWRCAPSSRRIPVSARPAALWGHFVRLVDCWWCFACETTIHCNQSTGHSSSPFPSASTLTRLIWLSASRRAAPSRPSLNGSLVPAPGFDSPFEFFTARLSPSVSSNQPTKHYAVAAAQASSPLSLARDSYIAWPRPPFVCSSTVA